MKEKKILISVRTIQGKQLRFRVKNYTINEGHFLTFYDDITKKWKRFHTSNCEIDEIKETRN